MEKGIGLLGKGPSIIQSIRRMRRATVPFGTTVGVAHSADIKVSDLVTNTGRFAVKNLPQCPLKNCIGGDFSLAI